MIKVIVADDEEKVCRLICSLIDWASLGMEVAGTAHNGQQALELVRELQPDIIITDIRMPGFDGLELIRRARAEQEGLEFIIISGYRHFEYAQSAIKYGVSDYLLKPIKQQELYDTLAKLRDEYLRKTRQMSMREQMEIRLQSDMDKLRCGLLQDLLQEREPAAFTLQNVNDGYHYAFENGCFQVFIFKIDCPGEDCGIMEEKALYDLQAKLKPVCYDMQAYQTGGRIYGVLNFGSDDASAVRRTLQGALAELESATGIMEAGAISNMRMSIGLGSVEQEIVGLHRSLECAEAALAQRLMDTATHMHEPVGNDHGFDDAPILVGFQKQLAAALDVMDRELASQALDGFEASAMENPQPSGQQLMGLVHDGFRTAVMLLRGYTEVEEARRVAFEEGCDRLGSAGELFNLLREGVLELLDTLLDKNEQDGLKPVRLARQYINENYMNPISLDSVSEYVGFNPSYFSTLFKKESGMNFQEYLLEVRMNKAKELLKESRDTVASICAGVGYSDTKHFTRNFKKHTGLKPNEYRKLFS